LTFVESCVDFEVAHLIYLYSWFRECHTRRFLP